MLDTAALKLVPFVCPTGARNEQRLVRFPSALVDQTDERNGKRQFAFGVKL